jgi:hypothetical protein
MYGLDTETPMGNLGCIATNDECVEASTFEEVMAFLGKHKYQGAIFWLFNAQFDCEHILKSTGDKDFLLELYEDGVTRPGVEYKGYHIQYIPKKLMKICKNKHCVTLYDIAQFYRGASLEMAGKQYLPEQFQKDTSSVDRVKIGAEEGYYERHRALVLEYCKQDAIATLALAKLIEGTFTSKGISFRTPISMAKISETYVYDHYDYPKVPDTSDMNMYHSFAQAAFHGGLFWTLKRGYFRQPLYSFDINSAYPSVMVTLPHWANGRFSGVNEPSGERFGWFLCEFDCQWIPKYDYELNIFTEEYNGYGPVEKILTNKRKIYPTGMRKQWITAVEYRWMLDNGFPCKFITGCEWHFVKDKYKSPFEWMGTMYNERLKIVEKDKTGMLQYALKILLNGLYGKTCQSKKGLGKMTNFFYASYITAETRLKVAEVAMRHPNETIEIATDSVTLTKDISAEIPLNKKLGAWGLDTYTEGLFIGSGMRQEWKLGGESITYARGLTDRRDYNLKADMDANRNKAELTFSRQRPIHMGEMLVQVNKLHFHDLGVFMDVKKTLKVNTDTKSLWEREYVDFGDFLDSRPMQGVPLEV